MASASATTLPGGDSPGDLPSAASGQYHSRADQPELPHYDAEADRATAALAIQELCVARPPQCITAQDLGVVAPALSTIALQSNQLPTSALQVAVPGKLSVSAETTNKILPTSCVPAVTSSLPAPVMATVTSTSTVPDVAARIAMQPTPPAQCISGHSTMADLGLIEISSDSEDSTADDVDMLSNNSLADMASLGREEIDDDNEATVSMPQTPASPSLDSQTNDSSDVISDDCMSDDDFVTVNVPCKRSAAQAATTPGEINVAHVKGPR